jgi:hypothetical protein
MQFIVCRNQVLVCRSLLFINKYLATYACSVNESYTMDVENAMHILYIVYSKLTNCILVSSDLGNTGSTVLEFLINLCAGQEPSRNRVLVPARQANID